MIALLNMTQRGEINFDFYLALWIASFLIVHVNRECVHTNTIASTVKVDGVSYKVTAISAKAFAKCTKAKCVLKHTFIMEAMMLFYLFTVKDSAIYFRITFYLMIPFYIMIDYGIRCLWKYRIRRKGVRENARTIIIVVPGKRLGSCVKEVVGENYAAYRCAGVVASDDSIAEGSAAGVPVVCKYADRKKRQEVQDV